MQSSDRISLRMRATGLAQRVINRLLLGRRVFAELRHLRSEVQRLQAACKELKESYAMVQVARSDVEALRAVCSRLTESCAKLHDLRPEMENLQAACSQLQDVIQEAGGVLPPPRHLQVRVIGGYSSDFLKSGRDLIGDLDAVLACDNKSLRSFEKILDFGCGCGRVLRPLRHRAAPSQMLYGTDIDAEAIEWCRANYPRIAEFGVNPEMPPMRYPDAAFDFVYSVSIFTHLPEDMQFAWLQELQRIARPGGYLVLSVHGKHYYHDLPPEARCIMQEKGFYYRATGKTEGLPDFYQTAYHSSDYIRAQWSRYFDILAIREVAVSNLQDAVLCRRRGGE